MKKPFKFFGVGEGVQVIEVEPKVFIVFPKYIPPSTMVHQRKSGDAWLAFKWNPKNNRYEYFNTIFQDEFEGYIKKWYNATMTNVSIEQLPVILEMKVVFSHSIPVIETSGEGGV